MSIFFYKRLKAFGRRCFDSLGSFLRHPKTVSLLLNVLGAILVWLTKMAIVVLLSEIGVTISLFYQAV